MARLRHLAAMALVGLLVSFPHLAEACSVCTSGREEENQMAFILTTIFLSLLPPLCVGAVIFWLFRRAREVERAATAAAESTRPASLVS